MIALDEKKRPGRECNPAEPQSNANLGQDKHMNIHTDSTTGGNAPDARDQVTDAVGNLEGPLYDALNMVRIVRMLMEQGRYEEVLGQRCLVIGQNRAEALMWAVYQTETMFEAVHASWDEANEMTFDLRRAS
ncbi:hypothetical protein H9Q09_00735 [Aurantimonas sp. DM33-3]|uniref:hypothetical protein n=1 Tax=Aurantimonas sp. DM33-3 TaxID=2766955 RepID=UPI001651DD8F|nr:hypothetical protein [Aurantimonas sp. DM33-3]MBC6714711.1 hypothetical protein [Aurantimonas sp. DM33-3]